MTTIDYFVLTNFLSENPFKAKTKQLKFTFRFPCISLHVFLKNQGINPVDNFSLVLSSVNILHESDWNLAHLWILFFANIFVRLPAYAHKLRLIKDNRLWSLPVEKEAEEILLLRFCGFSTQQISQEATRSGENIL